jgi:spermidine/putrescine transport system substrate-binding protein
MSKHFNNKSAAMRPLPDPEIMRTLKSFGLSRRHFLRKLGMGAGGLLGGSLLAACGMSPQMGGAAPAPVATPGGPLSFANWPLYIDVEEDGTTSPTLRNFEKETNIKTEYIEEVDDNTTWFAKYRNQLAAGQDIGRDLTVLTDWMAARMIKLGWTEEITEAHVPNKANLLPALQKAAFDPGRKRSLTWQSGLTGIGYNPKLTGRELSSINDLFAPDLAGKVTFLSEMRDTGGLVMAAMGLDPVNHAFSDFEKAMARLKAATDSGQIRAFTGNEYANDLAVGNIAACVAWSGDIIQLQLDNPDLKFVVPAEGANLFSDNMLIPAKAAHKRNAEALMDYVYRPEVAAQIAAWVNYISPVTGAKAEMEKLDPDMANNELIFPSEKMLANTFQFKILNDEEDKAYQELFQKTIGA